MVHFMSVLIPLYLYPGGCSNSVTASTCAWKPLFDATTAYPTQNITVVVNPGSGPGTSLTTCPDANWQAVLAQLSKNNRVKLIGYSDSAFGARLPKDYKNDIQTYSNWKANCKINIGGIFIDDVRVENAGAAINATNLAYYKNFTTAIQTIMPSPQNFTMYNPGGPMQLPYFQYADSILTFEDFASNLNASGTIFNSGSTYKNTPRQKQAIVVHDYNKTALDQQQTCDDMGETQAVGHLYLTNDTMYPIVKGQYTGNPYDSFPGLWTQFVGSVNATNTYMAKNPQWFS